MDADQPSLSPTILGLAIHLRFSKIIQTKQHETTTNPHQQQLQRELASIESKAEQLRELSAALIVNSALDEIATDFDSVHEVKAIADDMDLMTDQLMELMRVVEAEHEQKLTSQRKITTIITRCFKDLCDLHK